MGAAWVAGLGCLFDVVGWMCLLKNRAWAGFGRAGQGKTVWWVPFRVARSRWVGDARFGDSAGRGLWGADKNEVMDGEEDD